MTFDDLDERLRGLWKGPLLPTLLTAIVHYPIVADYFKHDDFIHLYQSQKALAMRTGSVPFRNDLAGGFHLPLHESLRELDTLKQFVDLSKIEPNTGATSALVNLHGVEDELLQIASAGGAVHFRCYSSIFFTSLLTPELTIWGLPLRKVMSLEVPLTTICLAESTIISLLVPLTVS